MPFPPGRQLLLQRAQCFFCLISLSRWAFHTFLIILPDICSQFVSDSSLCSSLSNSGRRAEINLCRPQAHAGCWEKTSTPPTLRPTWEKFIPSEGESPQHSPAWGQGGGMRGRAGPHGSLMLTTYPGPPGSCCGARQGCLHFGGQLNNP